MAIARSIHITGHVQGVFFREWTVRTASEIGIAGWVRNRADGSVEVYAAGEADQVERLIAELRSGPPSARVDDIKIEPAELDNDRGFMRRSTL